MTIEEATAAETPFDAITFADFESLSAKLATQLEGRPMMLAAAALAEVTVMVHRASFPTYREALPALEAMIGDMREELERRYLLPVRKW